MFDARPFLDRLNLSTIFDSIKCLACWTGEVHGAQNTVVYESLQENVETPLWSSQNQWTRKKGSDLKL